MAPQERWIWILYFTFLWIVQIASKEVRVVCYYTNWSVYRPGSAKFSPQNINPYLCTHLVYAFGGFTKENTLKPFDKYQDIEKGGYAKFTGLKTYNKNLKTMLAIGGWNEGSSRFSPMVASAERRKELVKNVVKFLRQNHFDGLDLDWEYPSFRDGGKSRDRDNYAQLVQELREEFERESQKTGRTRLLLTMAVPAGIEYINKGYDVPKLMKYLDWMNILSYDYHSAFEPSVNHHAPLYPLEEDNEYNYDTDLNIDHTIKHYLKAGAISEKLVLGIPTYGRSYTLFNPDANEIGAPADGPGEMGDATRENGYLAYYEICESVNSGEWTVVQPNDNAMGPYAFKDNQWVGYDDESIARKKSQYVAENNLGGIMFWAIDNDDFRGTCHNKSYPIIEAAKEALVEALGLTEENVISKPTRPTKTRGRPRPTSRTTETPAVKERTQNSGGRQSSSQSSDKPSSRRRVVNRVRGNNKEAAQTTSTKVQKGKRRRRPTTKSTLVRDEPVFRETGSSLVVTTPSYKTPEPPTTPDPGGDFKCEDEGFFPHPRDCKKYFWCLSGPSELGIIAHQFTCPAGLYFNKAAASCDYTQNVLCNKKRNTTPKPTTAATTSVSTTESSKPETTKKSEIFNFSTKRPAAKITAATSRTTFYSTTTTEAPEYYDEYEYDDDVDDEEEDNADSNDSEDPRVIKELLELIKKAGGIEELEKQLNIKTSDTTQGEGSTTQSTITKKLYERVLAKAKLGDSLTTRKNNSYSNRYNSINRNSRGPQNEGISEDSDKKEKSRLRESRPQYSTITRQRASKVTEEEDVDDDEDDADEPATKEQKEVSQGTPKYVTLRRSRPTTSTVEPDVEDSLTKLGESRGTTSTSRSPYVTLRRSRPTTASSVTEESTAAEGKTIRRRPTGDKTNVEDEEAKDEVDTSSPNYVLIQRNRPSTTEGSTSKYKELVRGTTAIPGISSEDAETNEPLTETIVTKSPSSHRSSTQPDTNSITNASDDLTNPIKTKPIEDAANEKESEKQIGTQKFEIKPPKLFEPRPFSISNNAKTTTSTTTEKPTTSLKVSPKPLRSRPVVTEAQDSNNVNNNNSNNKLEGGYNRGRNRGASRFKVPEVTTQTISSYNGGGGSYEEYERHYRPDLSADISDLSSLTAVDFSLKSFTGSSQRRIRPRITPEPTSTTTTEKPEENLKTGSRTLPLARKFLEGSSFGGRRRTTAETTSSTTSEAPTQVTRKTFKRIFSTTPKDADESVSNESDIRTEANGPVFKFKRPVPTRVNNTETETKFKRPVLPSKTVEEGEGVIKIKRPIFRPKTKVEDDEEESDESTDNLEERKRYRSSTTVMNLNENEEGANKKRIYSSNSYQESDTLRRRIRPLSTSSTENNEESSSETSSLRPILSTTSNDSKSSEGETPKTDELNEEEDEDENQIRPTNLPSADSQSRSLDSATLEPSSEPTSEEADSKTQNADLEKLETSSSSNIRSSDNDKNLKSESSEEDDESHKLSDENKEDSNETRDSKPVIKIKRPSTPQTITETPGITKLNRKIIRRFRVTTPTTTTLDDSKTNEEIKISKANPELNNIGQVPIPYARKVRPVTETPEAENVVNSTEDEADDDELDEEENIKLSESNILENSDLNRANNNAINDQGKKGHRKVIKRIKFTTQPDEPSTLSSTTESIASLRTRKIIRKLPTTTEAVDTDDKKVIIRKFRPKSTTASLKNDEETTTESLKNRIKFGLNKKLAGEKVASKQLPPRIKVFTRIPPSITTTLDPLSIADIIKFNTSNETTSLVDGEDEKTELSPEDNAEKLRRLEVYTRNSTTEANEKLTDETLNQTLTSTESSLNVTKSDLKEDLTTEKIGVVETSSVKADDDNVSEKASEEEEKSVLSAKRLKVYSRPKPIETESTEEVSKDTKLETSKSEDEALLAKRLKLYTRTTTPKPSTTKAIKEEKEDTDTDTNTESTSEENEEQSTDADEIISTTVPSNEAEINQTETPILIENTQTTESSEPTETTTEEAEITTIDSDIETTTDYESVTEPKPSTPVYVNKIYKSAGVRPKLNLKSRLGLKYSTEATVGSSTRSSKFEARSRKPNRFRTSSSTEANRVTEIHSDDVGYGTVKPFKKLFVSTDRPRFRIKNLKLNDSDEESDEEYDYDDDEEDEEEEVVPVEQEKVLSSTTGKYYVNTNSFNRALYVKPTTESVEVVNEEDDGDEDEDFHDDDDEEEEEAISRKPFVVTSKKPVSFISTSTAANLKNRKANNPYDATTKRLKTSTRAYRRFTSTTPQTTTQNLTDINIEALNQRNKQLFNKTRKMNTPHPGPVSSDSSSETGVVTETTISSDNSSVTNSTEAINEGYVIITNTTESVNSTESKFAFSPTYPKSAQSGTVVGTTNFGSTIEVTNEVLVESKSPETTTDTIMYTTNPSEISADDLDATTLEPPTIRTTTTEKPTTFYHIFAETEGTTSSTLNPEDLTPETPNDRNKVERLIEVNRIVHINGENDTQEMHRVVDQVGVVNRVTVIKIVDGNNLTNTSGDEKVAISFNGPNILTELIDSGLKDKSGNREDRKFEIYGDSKVSNSLNNQYSDVINAKIGQTAGNYLTIESKSSVKTITPKPLFSNEVSTIALEGLFMTHKPETKEDGVIKTIEEQIQESVLEKESDKKPETPLTTEYEELLETENSHYVNVKVKNPNNIFIVRPDEDVTMKADVVEISRPLTSGLIKIAPISVSFQKRIPNIK